MKNFTKDQEMIQMLEKVPEPKLFILWLSGDEVCDLLKISKRTLQSYRDRKIVPYSQIGRKIYYKYSEIMDYLHNHHIKADFQKGGQS